MKKAFIAIICVIVVALLVFLGWQAYKMLENNDPNANSGGTGLGETVGDGDRQPAPNRTPNTGADLIEALADAKLANPDTVAWLKIDGTDIDNSVLQSHDNDFYLRHTEAGEYDVYGCYFADYECNVANRDTLSPNTVIYGHSDLQNNPDGLRFSQLFKFTSEDFAKATPCIYMATANDYLVWQVMAVFYTDTGMDYIDINKSDIELENLVLEARSKSLYNYDVTYTAGEKILCLSTCSVKYGGRPDERFVVMAKLLPADAEAPLQATFSVNPSPVKPSFAN